MKTHLGEEQFPTSGTIAAMMVLVALLAGPIAVMATLANSPPRDGAVLAEADALAGSSGARPPVSYAVPADSGDVGPFAFGYLEFDWDPKAPGGVPGFDSWPPGSAGR